MTRRLWIIAAQIPLGLAILGVLVFVGGIAAEYLVNRGDPFGSSSPSGYTTLALLGLGMAALMLLVWFVAIAILLGVQTRRLGSGYGEAYRLIEAFKFDDAIPLLRQSIAEGKETVDVLMLLASAYAYSGRLAEAQQVADRVVALYPAETAAYLTLSNVYRMQAAYDAATEALLPATRLEPESAVIWAELGFMQLYAGDAAGARESFERAALHPLPSMYAVRVYYHLADFYAASGDAVQAARSAAKMVSARDGLASWQSGLQALRGTSYGQQLARDLEVVGRALREADAAHSG
ncbi:MAG: tetratricopeptide repeat protein [Anaerolineae bacterium]|nr:tetratricopeptide repeat protein [Anaerolineae bacterium]